MTTNKTIEQTVKEVLQNMDEIEKIKDCPQANAKKYKKSDENIKKDLIQKKKHDNL
jgi:hypothetical protein